MRTKLALKHAFTLIELLVVIAIIGLLLAIIIPSLKKATEITRKVICKSNQRQLGMAFSAYESECNYNFRKIKSWNGLSNADREKSWFWVGGTADLGHEDQPRAIKFMMNSKLLPDRKILFCPGVKNLDHNRNYPLSRVTSGDYTPWNTEDIYRAIEMHQLPVDDRPLFWGTYAWIWKKEMRDGDTSILRINNLSSGAMMVDMTNGLWKYAQETDPSRLGMLMRAVSINRLYSHGNVLMQDFSVQNPSDQDDKMNEWLWGIKYWAGNPVYDY